MKSKAVLSSDAEHVAAVTAALKENQGYCPCKLDKTEETKCMCKEFRDILNSGLSGTCHCGLYTAVIQED